MRFFLVSKGSFNQNIRFLGQKVCSVAWLRTDTQTTRHTRKWLLWASFQGFRCFSFNLSSRIGPTSTMGYCSRHELYNDIWAFYDGSQVPPHSKKKAPLLNTLNPNHLFCDRKHIQCLYSNYPADRPDNF